MKFGRQPRHIRLEALSHIGDLLKERQRDTDAEQPVDQVAERQSIACRITTVSAFENWVYGAA